MFGKKLATSNVLACYNCGQTEKVASLLANRYLCATHIFIRLWTPSLTLTFILWKYVAQRHLPDEIVHAECRREGILERSDDLVPLGCHVDRRWRHSFGRRFPPRTAAATTRFVPQLHYLFDVIFVLPSCNSSNASTIIVTILWTIEHHRNLLAKLCGVHVSLELWSELCLRFSFVCLFDCFFVWCLTAHQRKKVIGYQCKGMYTKDHRHGLNKHGY